MFGIKGLIDRRVFCIVVVVCAYLDLEFFTECQLVCHIQLRIEVVAIRIFKFDLDPFVLGDHLLWRKGHFGRVVVDDIILVLTSLYQHPIDPHSFRTCKHDEKLLIVGTAQSVWTLVTFETVEDVAGKLTLGYRTAE